jgi:hypothetical protein
LHFAFFLAHELKMTVENLLNNMSTEEFDHWKAFFILRNEESERAAMAAEVKSKLAGGR